MYDSSIRTLLHRGQYSEHDANLLYLRKRTLAGVCGAIFLTTVTWEAVPTTGPLLNTADCVIACQREKSRQCTLHAKRSNALQQLHLYCLFSAWRWQRCVDLPCLQWPGNTCDIIAPRPRSPPAGPTTCQIMRANGEPSLALLPTRFRKLIWVKRGDYLITSTSAGDFETSAGETGKVGASTPCLPHLSRF